MAEEKTKKKKKVKTGKGRRQKGSVSLPSKRSLNLAEVGIKPINIKLAVLGILLILGGAVLLAKFAVSDRLTEMSRAQSEVQAVQSELDSLYAEMETYGDLMDRYAHYTYSGMTAEELGRVERTKVVELIEKVIVPQAAIGSWSVRGNELTINITGKTLQEINLIIQSLEEEPIVDFCKVTTAVMNESNPNQNQLGQAASAGEASAGSGDSSGLVDAVADKTGSLVETLEADKERIESGEYENVVTDGADGTSQGSTNSTIDLATAPVNANLTVYLTAAGEEASEE